MEAMLIESNVAGKIRFILKRAPDGPDVGVLTHIGAAQGHSKDAQSMIVVEEHLTPAFLGDGRTEKVMLHGTRT